MKKVLRSLFFVTAFALIMPLGVFAQDGFGATQVEATITSIFTQEELDGGVFRYVLEATTQEGEVIMIDTVDSFVSGVGYHLKTGDKVILQAINAGDDVQYFFDDVHRERNLWSIMIFFAFITVAIGLWRGVFSLVGLVVTVGILVFGLFPSILGGADPLLATVLTSAVILGVNMHLAHGFNKKTTFAFASTLFGLGLVVVFTQVFLRIARLSGLAGEEGVLLFWELDPVQIPVGILAAGIVLGAVGVLDDIAITQTQVVDELVQIDPEINRVDLFKKAMRVGRHHIASTVNTLVLVYAGAALPSVLLYLNQTSGLQTFINNELIAEEIVRTLAGTCALVLTVPLSTWFATLRVRSLTKK